MTTFVECAIDRIRGLSASTSVGRVFPGRLFVFHLVAWAVYLRPLLPWHLLSRPAPARRIASISLYVKAAEVPERHAHAGYELYPPATNREPGGAALFMRHE